MAATPAIAALDAAGVDYEVSEYVVPDVTGRHAEGRFGDAVVDALGLDPDRVGKTLIAMLDGNPVVAVVPVAGTLDLKALARTGRAKRAVMADHDDAERLSGSVVGGIAPLGHRTMMPVFVDETLREHAVVHVSGGRRGLEISLAPAALIDVCGAEVAAISR